MSTSTTEASSAQEWNAGAIGVLIPELARLYDSGKDARRVFFDAGLERFGPQLNFEDEAGVTWYRLLAFAAALPGKVEAIIEIAAGEHADDARLAQARTTAAAWMRRERSDEILSPLTSSPAEPNVGTVDDATPLVDREDLVEFVRSELKQVNATESGRALLLIGDSGVGKTRLAECAVRAAHDLDVLVLEAQCVARGAQALLPLRKALRSYTGRPTIEEILSESPSPAPDYVPFLRSFVQIDSAGTSGPRLGGDSESATWAGLAEVLLGLARRRGLCLVVENLTDADDETLYFLDYFRRKASANRVLTLATARREFVEPELRALIDEWKGNGICISPVPPLEPEDAAELVSRLWPGPPLSDEQIDLIVKITEGNPFFIKQYVRVRIEDPSFDADAVVPGDVRAVLQRRVHRLDQDTRGFLEAAAVALEASGGLDVIAHLAGVDHDQSSDLLRRAVEARCLSQDAKGDVLFVQELLRRVVYEDIAHQDQAEMHRRAAEWLRRAGLLASAAHHYEKAGLREEFVQTALQAAEQSEHAGLYRTAVQLYERAQRYVEAQTFAPRLAKAYLVVGELAKAKALVARLPADEPEVRLLRSQLCFVRGEFGRARKEIELALGMPSADRFQTLVRLADIDLHVGELERAGEHAKEALAEAGSPTDVARCTAILGAAAFFAGDVNEGERLFVEAVTTLASQPPEKRDPVVYTTILGNLASVSEVRGRWDAAKRLHEEALAKRREVSDARGVLQSLHAVARSDLALGSLDVAVASLEEAQDLASDLGDQLEQGKLDHTFVEVELRRGAPSAAVSRAEAALAQFREANTAYDVAHARFSLARALAANGDHRRAIEEGAAARLESERGGFGLLATLFPNLAFSYDDRIAAGLVGYACGDAFGLPWEGRASAEIDVARAPSLPMTGKWPKGATSDDTALTLLVAEHLAAARGPDGAAFLAGLVERAPGIKGLGPSTPEAIAHVRRTGAPPTGNGNTNGALMRSLPIGWALPLDRAEDRRAWTIELSRATHPGPDACCAALVGSACAAWAIEGAEPRLLIEVARAEAAATTERCGTDGRIDEMLAALAAGSWQPDPDCLGPDAYETLLRVLWCILAEPRLPQALVAAVRLGGDTDTVAALVGGLLGCRETPEAVRAYIPWSGEVHAPDDAVIRRLATALADLRTGRVSG